MKYQIKRYDYDGTKEVVERFKWKSQAIRELHKMFFIARGYHRSLWMKKNKLGYVVYDSENDHVLYTCSIVEG